MPLQRPCPNAGSVIKSDTCCALEGEAVLGDVPIMGAEVNSFLDAVEEKEEASVSFATCEVPLLEKLLFLNTLGPMNIPGQLIPRPCFSKSQQTLPGDLPHGMAGEMAVAVIVRDYAIFSLRNGVLCPDPPQG